MINRLRRSFRESFRRKRDRAPESDHGHQWHTDEIAVRQGNCAFSIKYLGCTEVQESRGMITCEKALIRMRSEKGRKTIRGTLFVSGDGLRVVDGETRGLIVDQTIEKVSFCAPDRTDDRGFAYICREGATRRWMCHGFTALGNTGERLSHAVGCAFAICLERKQKREQEVAEMAAAAAAVALKNQNTHNGVNSTTNNNNIETGSRIHRTFKLPEPPPVKQVINPYAIDRPHATPLMLQRQTSFRPLSNLRSQSPFKRQLSLKLIGSQAANTHNNLLKNATTPVTLANTTTTITS